MRLLFWISAALLGYTFAGYQWIISRLAARRHPAPALAEAKPGPRVAALVVACNEEARIEARIANLRECPFPVEVVIASDGSTDATAARARASGARVFEFPGRRGKAACLSDVIPVLEAEIVVLADARQRFEPGTIPRLCRHFADGGIGAVSGLLVIGESNTGAGSGVGAYWRLETRLRAAESRLDSCIGCTGAVYAVRRSLFQPIPHDTILDDVVIPMRIALAGARVLYDEEARAFDPQPLDPEAEAGRKSRTLAGNYQMLFRQPAWLLPWRNRLAWQLVSHKYLRLGGPFFLLGVLISSVALRRRPFYATALAVQGLMYGLGGLGLGFPRLRGRMFSIPAGFVFLNWMTLRGLVRYIFVPRSGAWEARRATAPSGPREP